jgi:hypothetical protein
LALRVQEDQMLAVNFCARCDQHVGTSLRRLNADAVTLVCHLRPHLCGVAQGSLKQVKKQGSSATGRLGRYSFWLMPWVCSFKYQAGERAPKAPTCSYYSSIASLLRVDGRPALSRLDSFQFGGPSATFHRTAGNRMRILRMNWWARASLGYAFG